MKFQIQISLSADGYKKGNRVVVKEAKDNWYLGTVAMSGANIKVVFDDGASAMIEAADFKHVKLVDPKTRPRKKVLTDAEAKAMHIAGKPAPTLRAAQTKVAKIKAPVTKSNDFTLKKNVVCSECGKPAKIGVTIKGKDYAEQCAADKLGLTLASMRKLVSAAAPELKVAQTKVPAIKSIPEAKALRGQPTPKDMLQAMTDWDAANPGKPFSSLPTRKKNSLVSDAYSSRQYGELSVAIMGKPKPPLPSARPAEVVRSAPTPKPASGTPDPDAAYPERGWVFNIKDRNPSDEYIVTGYEIGRVITKVNVFKLNDRKSKTSLYNWKLRGSAKMRFNYVRKATPAEIELATGKRQALDDHYDKRTADNQAAKDALQAQVGDVVLVKYTDGAKNEIVTDINHATGKVAIYRPAREMRGMKRRFIHIKYILSVVLKGPGRFDASNPIYVGQRTIS